MRSRLFPIMCAMLLGIAFMMSACSKDIEKMSAKEVASLVTDEVDFSPLVAINDEGISNYFTFKLSSVEEYSAEVSTSEESADEYGVFKAVSKEAQDEVVDGIMERLTARTSLFRQTSETEYKKLQNAVVRQRGDLIIYFVCENYNRTASILDDHGAKPVK